VIHHKGKNTFYDDNPFASKNKDVFLQYITHNFINDCLLCDGITQQPSQLICNICLSDLELFPLGCDLLMSYPNICDHIKHDALSGLAVVSNYQWPFEQWIPQVKFHNQINSAKVMGELLNQHLKHTQWITPDLLCPMPIHHKRLQERGYNQADLLCQFIDYSSGLTLCTGLTRTKYTQAQTELNKTQRKMNMKQAFSCDESVKGKRVLLVDDVITTGHTANAAAQALLDAGATAVYLAAVAIRKYT